MRAIRAVCWIPLLATTAWWTLVLFFAGPEPQWVAVSLAVIYGAGSLAMLVLVRPFHRSLAGFLVTFEVLLLWRSSIHSSNRRDWARDVARIPHAEVKEDLLTIHNVRNLDYPSETDFRCATKIGPTISRASAGWICFCRIGARGQSRIHS